MNWTEVNIYTSTDGIELLCECLMGIGIKGFVIKDSNDFKNFLENSEGHWDYIDKDLMGLSECETCITIYIPENSQGSDVLSMVKSQLIKIKENDKKQKFGRLEIEMTSVKEEDWANNWKKYFKPFKVGNKLIIKPSWEEYENTDDRIILEIDPASSFGTGQHNTTRLCLEFLEYSIEEGDKLLDLGCGSGILSIGGLLLGAGKAIAVDIEENAAFIANENLKKNNINSDRYNVYCGNALSDDELCKNIGTGFDVITANIVADVLIAMSSLFKCFINKNGILIISGIISERRTEVLDSVVAAGFILKEVKEKDDWIAAKLIMK